VDDLVRQKAAAVEVEDFDSAKECKATLAALHGLASKIFDLEKEKVMCIYEENFDGAKKAKNEMDALIAEEYNAAPSRAAKPMANPPKADQAKRSIVDMPPIDALHPRSSKNAFEDEPVRSKYALAMAAHRDEHPEEEEHDNGDETQQPPPVTAEEETDTRGPSPSPPPPPNQNNAEEEVEQGIVPIDQFDPQAFPKWEQEIFGAIHAEAGDGEEAPAGPVQASNAHTEVTENCSVLGQYMTACLVSKRWKLREVSVRVLAAKAKTLYAHVPLQNVVGVTLRFFNIRNYGLQDTIANVFVACCDFVQRTLRNQFDCLKEVMSPLLNLLPRLVSRCSDAAQKIKEEAQSTVLSYAACAEVGLGTTLNAVTADPLDQDKRRISTQNQRVQLSRLTLLQLLQQQFKFGSSHYDAAFAKLVLPCLNHSSSEVRDLAVSQTLGFIELNVGDVAKYLGQVSNAAIKATLSAAIESKKSLGKLGKAAKRNKPDEDGIDAADAV
jgi:hypothetical protein